MKYFGAILLIAVVFSIIVGGTYTPREMVDVSLQLIPTPTAQPALVESALSEFGGIVAVRHYPFNDLLEVTYDKARITLEDLRHLIRTMGYKSILLEPVQSSL